MFRFNKIIVVSLATLLLVGCSRTPKSPGPDAISSINILDHSGLSQTISSPDRIKQFRNVDFLKSQPYQKIMRIYGRDKKGNSKALITSYYPNGHPKQYLEAINSRAFGAYQEWYADGTLKLEARVIGGTADLNVAAQSTWLFDGKSQAWHEDGSLLAEIIYVKGELQGQAFYYHPNGKVMRQVIYEKGMANGTEEIFSDTGELLDRREYLNGLLHGKSLRYWEDPSCSKHVAAEEEFEDGRLSTGRYYDRAGSEIAAINHGVGLRAIYDGDELKELQEYHDGVSDGIVQVFDSNGALVKSYHVKDGLKHGEEIEYYPTSALRSGQSSKLPLRPKLSLHWYEDRIQGIVRTYFENGKLQSQREMSNNVKNGVSTAWYPDGSLMLIEEYDHDRLVKGEYLRKGERSPMSQVVQGKGICTLFDVKGNLLKKINYVDGKPIDEG